ncbi:MAG TPA: glucose-6-phosphate isomerase family protein [Methanobacterium sp.]|nr:glucose-6-phosphate isomerase family protein [Methanobacterium sp.]
MELRLLEFAGRKVKPDIRKLADMKEVVYDKNWLETTVVTDLYYMYRDLYYSQRDHSLILENNLRYDITIIPPSKLGWEYVKTAGHYHPLIENTRYTFPEVYEVLNGVAHYLLQKVEDSKVTDVILVEAKEGDKVIVPPNYGHVTINPSNKELKMANWVSNQFSSIYDPYRKYEGAAYFELINGQVIKNENYEYLPELRQLKPTNFKELGYYKNKEMYGLVRDSEKLDYLNHPQEYEWIWEKF